MPKGYKGFKEKIVTKSDLKTLKEEHPQLQKAAYESRFIVGELEKRIVELEKNLSTFSEAQLEISKCYNGLINLLLEKNLIEEGEYKVSIENYTRVRNHLMEEYKMTEMGYTVDSETTSKESLAKIQLFVYLDSELLSRKEGIWLKLDKTYIYPGLEEEVVGMKADEEKQFEKTMPVPFQIKDIEGKTLKFSIKVLKIKDKSKPEEK